MNYQRKVVSRLCEVPTSFFKEKCPHVGITHCQKYKQQHLENNEGWYKCLPECEVPFYEVTKLVYDKVVKQKKKKKSNIDSKGNKKVWDKVNNRQYKSDEDLLLDLLAYVFIDWPSKSSLISKAASYWWPGYASSWFISKEYNIKVTFSNMVKEGKLIYEKRKPVTIGD